MATTEHRLRPAPATDAGGDPPGPGAVIDGRYRLDALLGKGGMGVVYRAEHLALRRTVAVKLLHPGLAAVSDLRSRFEREAIAIGRIDHPNCVSVTDFGKLEDGSLFLVMELLDGRSLGDLLDEEAPLAPGRALRLLRQILAGLGHAHAAGIVHRDVKPENVFVVRDAEGNETAKVLDFGIAKVIGGGEGGDEVKLTQAGVAFGTPIYMSPEQAFGNPLDGRADLYAASVLAFEMIGGKPPFYADDKLELLSMHTSRPPPSMTAVRAKLIAGKAAAQANAGATNDGPGVTPAIEQLVLRGLAKRPEDRYANAAEYVAAIDAVLAGSGAGAARAAPPATTPAAPGRHEEAATPVTGALAVDTSDAHAQAHALMELTQPGALLANRRRLLRAAFVLATAVLLGVLAATMWRGRGAATAPPPDPATLAGRAAAQLQRGKPGEAIKTIESATEAARAEPEVQTQLGLAYAAARKNDAALAAYRRALELDPERGKDARLRASLQAIADDTDVAAATAALELMVKTLAIGSARAQVIREAAAPGMDRRRAMAALAEKLGAAHEVDWLASYLLDLDEGEVCAQRKPAVARLRALGDPRAIPALEAALERKGKVGKWRGRNVNECLVDDVKAALTYLRGLGARP
jgi:serine/threonine-protein kinase